MRVLLKVPCNRYTGYGNDGIGLAKALVSRGHDVQLMPTFVVPPLPQVVANLLTRRLEPPFDLLINHHDPTQILAKPDEIYHSEILVGWTMWESTSLSRAHNLHDTIENLAPFHKILAYDECSQLALKTATKPSKVEILQGGYEPELHPHVERDWNDKLHLCMVGALHQRKDPWVAIEAWRELIATRPDIEANARLHLKDNSKSLHPGIQDLIPSIRIHSGKWTDDVVRAFMDRCHVLLSPSRGEGKNMPALEMLSSGGTVIATNWGGHRQWLTPDIGYPLDYTLHPVGDDPNDLEARADKEHLKALIEHVYDHRAEARAKGENAARIVPTMCSWERAVSRLETRVSEWRRTSDVPQAREDYSPRPTTTESMSRSLTETS